MNILNKTHYFDYTTALYNTVVDPHSFADESSKRQSYSQRLYYEFVDTCNLGGIALFYTLTYNDLHIPTWYDGKEFHPCFSYEDIRYITNGALSKWLQRKFHCALRYFCACESGEGKGRRGLGNNPHYHFIFFLRPWVLKDGTLDPEFKCPSASEFRKKIRDLWHGTDKRIDYREAKYGIAREGDNMGVCDSSAAFKYVSKYVLKDNLQKSLEGKVLQYGTDLYTKLGIDSTCMIAFYKYNKLETDCPDPRRWWYTFDIPKYLTWRRMTVDQDKSYQRFVTRYSSSLHLKKMFTILAAWHHKIYVPAMAKRYLAEWRNQYGGKPRMSKSLGLAGLAYVKHVDTNPTFYMPHEKEVKPVKPCLYYQRKLYYDVYKCPYTGNNLYRLNERGKQLRLFQLPQRIEDYIARVKESLSIVTLNNDVLFRPLSEHILKRSLDNAPSCDYIIRAYSVYNLVYRYRHFDPSNDMISLNSTLSIDCILPDYESFLSHSFFDFDFNSDSILQYLEKQRPYKQDYSHHPVFDSYIPYFDYLDKVLDVVSSYRSDCAKLKFAETAELQKKHAKYKINKLYND